MTEGDGRESDTQHNNDYLYSDAPAPGSPNASNVRAYTRQYQYDKIGNVQQVKQLGTNGFTRNFVYNTGVNTLQKIEDGSSVNIQSFTYDDVGNQITAGTTRNYVWNAANELITYYNQAGSSDPSIFAQYNYSGGNRISKMVRTGSAGSPIYERVIYIDGVFEYHILENGTTYEKNYVHIMDDKSRIAMVRISDQFPDEITNTVTYNLEDQIGSSTVRLNTTGGVIDKEEYYPFGDSSLRTFSKKRYRYVGKEKDIESGLYYYGARYYAAWTCRFISIDPLAADYVHLTPYNNAGNKVINFKDIDGLQGEDEATSLPDPGSKVEGGNRNLIIVFAPDDAAIVEQDIEREANWDYYYACDMVDADNYANSYKKKYGEIENLVIVSHGATIEYSDGSSESGIKFGGVNSDSITQEDIINYYRGGERLDYITEEKNQILDSTLSLLKTIKDNGSCVLYSCNGAKIPAIGGVLSKMTDSSFNLYLNNDLSSFRYYAELYQSANTGRKITWEWNPYYKIFDLSVTTPEHYSLGWNLYKFNGNSEPIKLNKTIKINSSGSISTTLPEKIIFNPDNDQMKEEMKKSKKPIIKKIKK